MNWLRDAYDTLETVLTYGNVDDQVFRTIVAKYREMARDMGRSDDFESIVREVVALKGQHLSETLSTAC